MIGFATLMALWRGHTNTLESLIVFPGGFANGIAHSAVFIGLTSGVDENEIAIAIKYPAVFVGLGPVRKPEIGLMSLSVTSDIRLKGTKRKEWMPLDLPRSALCVARYLRFTLGSNHARFRPSQI